VVAKYFCCVSHVLWAFCGSCCSAKPTLIRFVHQFSIQDVVNRARLMTRFFCQFSLSDVVMQITMVESHMSCRMNLQSEHKDMQLSTVVLCVLRLKLTLGV
jgi:hypothetical protein